MLVERLILFATLAFVDSVDTLFDAFDREDFKCQPGARKDLRKMDQFAKNMHFGQFLRALSTTKQFAPVSIQCLNPFATNKRFDNSESVTVLQEFFSLIADGTKPSMLDFH